MIWDRLATAKWNCSKEEIYLNGIKLDQIYADLYYEDKSPNMIYLINEHNNPNFLPQGGNLETSIRLYPTGIISTYFID